MFPLSFFCMLKGFSQETWWALLPWELGFVVLNLVLDARVQTKNNAPSLDGYF